MSEATKATRQNGRDAIDYSIAFLGHETDGSRAYLTLNH